ncbi:hypothetical protein [Nocardiopsis suaedae]|uniref:Uncharacterized protein n=1 Tax=Nocardiopsis suaedae TaxID=3018444 RepID=A0ABT4TII6_9ACTN|nr:hypothetical protein [Nocardiopsis suaedae]MDA2803922.1 hypothetical protein [Nocardiopsis suaedae]
MNSTLTEHAHCLYGDEYRPTPPCTLEHREHYLVERMAFADALLSPVREPCPNIADGHLPVRIRNLAYRLALPSAPTTPH